AQEHKGKKIVDNPYSKDKFEYDEANDQFICPNGDVLIRKAFVRIVYRANKLLLVAIAEFL
ncbi:hypothetical protein C5S39_13625, partial [Candidatus Methanophagaceae archaeon]